MERSNQKQELCLAYVRRSGEAPSLSHYTRPSARGYLTLRRRELTSVQAPVWPTIPLDENCSAAAV